MKKIYKQTLRCALAMLVALFAFANMAWAQTGSTREQVNIDQSVGAGFTLQPGKMYIVRSDMTLNATSGNGLNVAPKGLGQAPILYIPADVTVTVKGANASGTTGAGAGIYVPSNAELIITGAGTLVATGGNAANGGNGENGHNGGDKTGVSKDGQSSTALAHSGAGGKGGDGGGGAGAGIGGIGGQGGAGGEGGAAQYFTVNTQTKEKSGLNGSAGSNGSAGATMGKVYIMGTVKVTANSGSVGTSGGTGGGQGYSLYSNINSAWNVAGGGGGGAGGGAGYAAATCGIGAGGPGAGGGAGGGSGSVDWETNTNANKPDSDKNSFGHASSATGTGKGAQNGAQGTDNIKNRDNGGSGVFGWAYTETGGKGSDVGGNAGSNPAGANGYLFVGSNATVNGTKGSAPSYEGTPTSAPSDMQITITFVNNEFNSDGSKASNVKVGESININIGEPLPEIAASTYGLTANNKYFAGYYSSDQGLGVRIYKGIAENEKLVKAVNAVAFPQNVTLYAHFSHNKHNVAWDYTYQQIDGETYADVAPDDRVKRARLTFYYRDGTSESRIITAAEATRQGSSPAEDSHLTTTSAITLVSTGSETLSGNTITIKLDDAKLAQFTNYTLEALNNSEATVPTNWLVYTNASTHTTTISFTGANADKCFDLQWSVTLKGLKVFPEAIFVKPMFAEPDASDYTVISQLADNGNIHYDGVRCDWTAKPADNAESCTYTGSYPVWKYKDALNSYKNKIGLVGFILGGHTYYMDATPGNVHTDMVSLDTYNEVDNICRYTGSAASCTVKMDVAASVIPVLRLIPNASNATLSPTTLPIYVNNARASNISLTGYRAVRPGYIQTGWNTKENGTGTNYALDATEVPGTAALTLYAQWKETTPPVVTTEGISYEETKAVVTIKAIDESGIASLVYIMSATEILDFNPNTQDWSSAQTVETKGNDLYDIDITLPEAYLYVKVTDNKDNVSYVQSGKIVSDGIKPQVSIYPTGNVCNYPVTITVTDNYQVAKVEIKKGSAEYETVYNYSSGDILKEKVCTVEKLTSSTGEPIVLSVRVTDASDNVTIVENFTYMYCDHAWNESKSHTVVQKSGGTTTTYTYYECDHGCGHVWVENWKVGGTTFDKPNTGTGTSYSHTSSLSTDEEKLYQEQGLMRENTKQLFENTGSVVVKNSNGETTAVAHTVNDAITEAGKSENNVITLFDDAIVGGDPGASLSTPTNSVVIDLNGQSLYTVEAENETPRVYGDITGNAKVTILLKDDGATAYTNGSKVTGSPIKYHRTFAAATRKNNWQALYLPFDAGTVSAPDGVTYTFGTPTGVNIASGTAELEITKGTTSLAANTHYFVKSSNGEVLIEKNVALLAATTPTETEITGSGTYTIKGSLTDGDNVATKVNEVLHSYWILTNGGSFTMAKAGSHQRPYHWVIYDNTQQQAKPISMVIVEIDDITAAETVVDAAGAALSGDVYSISGMKMPKNAKLPQGIYISNGKKFHVK